MTTPDQGRSKSLSADGQRELKTRRAAVDDAERRYSDEVLLLVETLRRLGREEPRVPVRVLARIANQPEVFVRMALEGVVQTTLVTGNGLEDAKAPRRGGSLGEGRV